MAAQTTWFPDPEPVYVTLCDGKVRETTGPAQLATAPMPAPRVERDAWSYESCDRTLYLRSY